MYADAERVLPRKVPLTELPAKQKKQSICKTIVPGYSSLLPFHTDQWLTIHHKKPQLFLLFFNFLWYNSPKKLESKQSNSP